MKVVSKKAVQHLYFELPTERCIRHNLMRHKHNLGRSDHYNGETFYNHAPRPAHLTKSNLLKWIATRHQYKAEWTLQQNQALHPAQLDSSVVMQDWQAYFIGHATVLLKIGDYHFLTDPVWCDFVSPVRGLGPKRYRPMGLALEQLPKIDAVLLSHNHYDHMDLATLNWLVDRFNMPIFTGLANAAYLPKHFNVIELDWWQDTLFGEQDQFKIVYVPAQHGSGRGVRDQNQALWGGFSVLHDTGHAYFAGDAAYSQHFAEIYQRLGAPKLALLPIGAYEPRRLMQYLHMNPEDAVKAHLDLHAQYSLAIHHRMFQLTDESMFQPEQDLAIALDQYQVEASRFVCLMEGQSINVA